MENDQQERSQIEISSIQDSDAGEVLTVQRAAFVSEAAIYGSVDMPPLTQTLAELEAELRTESGFVARIDGRLVGAIRFVERDGLLLIGRMLLEAAEESSNADVAELFTGSLSEANLRLYESCGYEEHERIPDGDGTAQVFLRKRLRP